MKRIRTVKVNRGGVPVVINESAFNPQKEKLWKGEEPPKQPPAKPKAEIIGHKGGWYTVKAGGKLLTDGKVRKEEAEQIAADFNAE